MIHQKGHIFVHQKGPRFSPSTLLWPIWFTSSAFELVNQIPTCCHPTNTLSTIWCTKLHHHCQLHEKKLRSTKSQLFLTPDPFSTGIQGRKLITTQDKTLSNHKTHNYLWLLVAVKSYCYLDQKNCKKPLPPTLLRNEKKTKSFPPAKTSLSA